MAASILPGNAIEQRLERIEQAWFAFTADPRARLGRWRLDGDGIQLVEVFLEAQTVEDAPVRDFFLRLAVPFSDPLRYGAELRAGFLAEIEAAADDIREAGYDPVWPVPNADPGHDDIGHLLHCLHTFSTSYADVAARVIIVLMYGEIGQPAAWVWWLERLIPRLPSHLRFMVFDHAATPLLDDLAQRYPVQLRTLAPELDMPGAIDSLARQVGGSGPPDVLRRMFVGMNTAAARGHVAAALTQGSLALAVAQKHGWLQQVAVVHMALGGILLGAGRIDEALKAYRACGASATESMAKGEPGSDRVVVYAKLAEAGVLLQAADFAQAAQTYEAAVAAGEAQPAPDPLMSIESRRMAAYCYERIDRPDLAWTHLGKALQLGEAIDPAQRNQTTLPLVAQSLLRLASDPAASRQHAVIEARAAELLGPGWQTAAVTTA